MAVLGDGKLGLLVSQVLQAHGAQVHQYGRHKDKLRIAEQVGRRHGNREEAARGRKYEFVVEATGSSEGLRQAVQDDAATAEQSIMKSTVHGLVSMDTAPVIVNEITLVCLTLRAVRSQPYGCSRTAKFGRGCDDIGGAALEEGGGGFLRAAATPGVLKVSAA